MSVILQTSEVCIYNGRMGYRAEGFETDGVYHLLNRGVEQRHIYEDDQDYHRFISLLEFHRLPKPLAFSEARRASRSRQTDLFSHEKSTAELLVDILCYCLMPNHFHLLVRQRVEHGISRYMQRLLNSYSRYFNTRYRRTGVLFAGQFRGVRITSDAQLLHVSRYIHLNPITAALHDDTFSYPWSSALVYAAANTSNDKLVVTVSSELLTSMMPPKEYTQFVQRHVGYAKELAKIKHLLLEEGERIPAFTNSRSR